MSPYRSQSRNTRSCLIVWTSRMSKGSGGGFFRGRAGMRAEFIGRATGRPIRTGALAIIPRDQGGDVPSVTIHDFRVTDAVLAQTDPDAGDVVYLGPAGGAAFPFVVWRRLS